MQRKRKPHTREDETREGEDNNNNEEKEKEEEQEEAYRCKRHCELGLPGGCLTLHSNKEDHERERESESERDRTCSHHQRSITSAFV